MCQNGNAITSLSWLCHASCFKVGYWLMAQGCICKVPYKIYGRWVFCCFFCLVLFTFQTDFAFYSCCLSSQIYSQSIARASWQQPKRIFGLQKLFSSRAIVPPAATGSWRPECQYSETHLTTEDGPAWLHPASSQASRSYSHATAWDALGEKTRPRVQQT